MKPLRLFFFFFALAYERIYIKTHTALRVDVIGPENILFAGTLSGSATFSPEILQAGAVKGLRPSCLRRDTGREGGGGGGA